jgi:hypothetical protein
MITGFWGITLEISLFLWHVTLQSHVTGAAAKGI